MILYRVVFESEPGVYEMSMLLYKSREEAADYIRGLEDICGDTWKANIVGYETIEVEE